MQDQVIGVTGGVGCGKSQVLAILKNRWNAGLVEMDAVGKLLMEPGQSCYQAICTRFADIAGLCLPDGRLNRKVLSQVVFADSDRLAQLDAIIHPAVMQFVQEQIRSFRAGSTGYSCLVLESAILWEAGYAPLCDQIWYVTAEKEVRIRRLMESRQYSRERCEAVMANQSYAELLAGPYPVVQIENNGSVSELEWQIEKLFQTFCIK